MSSINADSLRDAFNAAGQGQVFQFWDSLNEAEQQSLLEQASEIDLAELDRLNQELVFAEHHAAVDFNKLEPSPFYAHPCEGGDAVAWDAAKVIGEDALRAGRVACFVVAGGQGTRLGYDGPKGTFPVTPVSNKILFNVFADKIRGAREQYSANIPWFIMTSNLNHEATEQCFEENDYFGLGADTVHFFRQGRMAAVDQQGKIIMSGKAEIALTPDGHGGSLRALVRSGATAKMAEAGVDVISYFQVDNPLVKIIDPTFIGFHLQDKSDMSSKMIPKAYPLEKVGHFCNYEGKASVVEYSDMPNELQEQTLEDGNLRFRAGSVAIHIMARGFVERVGGGDEAYRLPFHRANKKIAAYDATTGESVTPSTPNGIKFEMFVFDALPFAKNPVIIEGVRSEEFSPVKNAEGVDSPKTSRDDQLKMWANWLKAVGVEIEHDAEGVPTVAFEISPAFADDPKTFASRWNALAEKPAIAEGTIIE